VLRRLVSEITRKLGARPGTCNGKQAVGELWGKFMRKDFRTEPHDFVAEGDKVVVLTTVHLEGETVESADVLTYYGDGKLVAFDTLADETAPDRVFAKYSPHRGGHPPARLTPPSARDRIPADGIGALAVLGCQRRRRICSGATPTVVRVCSPPTGGSVRATEPPH
jgi:hypothetical protein